MYFDNLNQLFFMQGHGGYVWLSFGLFWLLLGLNIWQAKVQHKKLFSKVKAMATANHPTPKQTDN